MHRLKTHLCLCLCIGMFSFSVKASEPSDEQLDELAAKHMTYVEPQNVVRLHTPEEETPRDDYKDRRGKWGMLIGVGYTNYHPTKYQPNFEDSGTYSDYYGGPSSPIEVRLQPKKNVSFGSFGIDLMGSYYNASSVDGSNLNLGLINLGLTYNADRLFAKAPYVVPYVEAGAYMVIYDESSDGETAYKGNSSPAPFFSVGLNFELDSLDSESAAITYKQTPLKAFYFYLEERVYLASGKSDDPDFSGNFWNLGLKAEF